MTKSFYVASCFFPMRDFAVNITLTECRFVAPANRLFAQLARSCALMLAYESESSLRIESRDLCPPIECQLPRPLASVLAMPALRDYPLIKREGSIGDAFEIDPDEIIPHGAVGFFPAFLSLNVLAQDVPESRGYFTFTADDQGPALGHLHCVGFTSFSHPN